jgi:hypothetical protein
VLGERRVLQGTLAVDTLDFALRQGSALVVT